MQFNSSQNFPINLNICRTFLKLAFCLNITYSSALLALPNVNRVVSGEVSIAQADVKTLQINQNTDKAIVNWNSFNIDANEKVHFQQPTNGVCLNRIDAANGMSQIHGSLSSNATIFLINQSGILFSKTAQVNVGGIIASAVDISDANFAENKFVFEKTATQSGAVINRGVINVADGGIAVLLGSSVANHGIIQTKLSNVALASGDKITLDLFGNDVLVFGIDTPATKSGVDENGIDLADGVNVTGKIINDGGHVFMTAAAVQGVFDNLINVSGVVRARTVEKTAGGIILVGYQGNVLVTGTLDVSGPGKLDQAGTIRIFGEHIIVDDYADFDVSAGAGQGKIYIGSKSTHTNLFRGFPFSLTPTNSVQIGSGVRIDAHATHSGYGCDIKIRSNFDISFNAAISAWGKTPSTFEMSSTNNMLSMTTPHGGTITSKNIFFNGTMLFIPSTGFFNQVIIRPVYKLTQWILG